MKIMQSRGEKKKNEFLQKKMTSKTTKNKAEKSCKKIKNKKIC